MDKDKEILEYKQKIMEFKRDKNSDLTIHQFCRDINWATHRSRQAVAMSRMSFKIEKQIQGEQHSKKQEAGDTRQIFTNIFWAGGGNMYSEQLVAVNNKGHVFLYNTSKETCVKNINHNNSVLNTCAIETNDNGMMAAGGFDGRIYLNYINTGDASDNRRDTDDVALKFTGHQGVVSCIKFLSFNFMLSASFDSVIMLWDVNSQEKPYSSFHDHSGEVSGLDVNEQNGNIFATGSGDTTVKLWDIRLKKPCICTFTGSKSSVNCVKFLPGSYQTLAAGSEDSFIKLFDLRALKEIGVYRKKTDNKSISNINFSKSGEILFAITAGSYSIDMWDLFDEGLPFAQYNYPPSTDADGKGIQQLSFNSKGDTLAIIVENQITLLK